MLPKLFSNDITVLEHESTESYGNLYIILKSVRLL